MAARHRLSDLPALISGHQRRRRRRSAGHHAQARLSRVARSGCDLDLAHVSVADGRLRLRRLRLLRRPPAVRDTGRFRKAGRRSPPRARSRSSSTTCRTTPPTSTHGSSNPDRVATNPKRDWYMWRDRADGAPNNWISRFGGSAWEWDPTTEQYYYHAFLKEQPDLNWRNPEVQSAMLDVLRFWYDRGVDGVRIDALRSWSKTSSVATTRPNPSWTPGGDPYGSLRADATRRISPRSSTSSPAGARCRMRIRERVLIGELWVPIERLVTYYGADGRGLHLPFNFHLILTRMGRRAASAALVEEYEAALPPGALAQLGARQPRPLAHCHPRRTGTGARGGHAAAHAARHADPVSGRRDRHAATCRSRRRRFRTLSISRAGARAGPRPGANADAVGHGAERRVLRTRCRAVAAPRRRLGDT